MKKLTDSYLKGLTVFKPTEIRDPATTGLVLRVSPKGTKTWNYVYRERDKKLKRIGIGRYPAISLHQARIKAGEYQLNRDKGLSPTHNDTSKMAVSDFHREWIDTRIANIKRPEGVIGVWKNHILSEIGEVKLNALTPSILLAVPEKRVKRGEHGLAEHTLIELKRFCDDAVLKGYLHHNPIAGATPKKLGVVKKKDVRLLTYDQMKEIWHYDKHPTMVTEILKVMMLTFTRSGEAQGMRWSELDLEARIWTIPANRMKAGKEHRVYITNALMDIIQDRELFRHGDYVFNRFGKAPTRTYTAVRYADLKLSFDDWRPHILRNNVKYLVEDCGVDFMVADACLAHSIGSDIARTYNTTDLFDKRCHALTHWGDLLAAKGVI